MINLPKQAIIVESKQVEKGRNKGKMKTTVLVPVKRLVLHNECVGTPDKRRQPKNLKTNNNVDIGNYTGCYSLAINGYNQFSIITGG